MCPVALFSLVRIYAEHHASDQWVVTTAEQAKATIFGQRTRKLPVSFAESLVSAACHVSRTLSMNCCSV